MAQTLTFSLQTTETGSWVYTLGEKGVAREFERMDVGNLTLTRLQRTISDPTQVKKTQIWKTLLRALDNTTY